MVLRWGGYMNYWSGRRRPTYPPCLRTSLLVSAFIALGFTPRNPRPRGPPDRCDDHRHHPDIDIALGLFSKVAPEFRREFGGLPLGLRGLDLPFIGHKPILLEIKGLLGIREVSDLLGQEFISQAFFFH